VALVQQAVEHSADCNNAVRNSKLTHCPRFIGRIVVYGETGQSGVGVNYSLLVDNDRLMSEASISVAMPTCGD
jgi:hypothetical protein